MSNIKSRLVDLEKEINQPLMKTSFLLLKPLFLELLWNKLSSASYIEMNQDSLVIFLEHNGDPRTNIEVYFDQYEVIIRIDELPISLIAFQSDPKYQRIKSVLYESLSGQYHIVSFVDKRGNVRKRELSFFSGIVPKRVYKGLFNFYRVDHQDIYEGLSLIGSVSN